MKIARNLSCGRYRTAKFVRRNRLAVTLAALAAVALGAGVAGTITQARRAERRAARADAERDFALRQLSRAEAINDLNAFLLSDAAPSGKPFTVGELLAHAERIVDRSQGETVQNRVELLVAIGRQYQMQDEHDKSRRVLAQAYELAGTLPGPSARARAGCAYASAIALAGHTERAEALSRAPMPRSQPSRSSRWTGSPVSYVAATWRRIEARCSSVSSAWNPRSDFCRRRRWPPR